MWARKPATSSNRND
ncbi:unnamed protein product [Spirodela intermedia]|uniref:Uncharacterized protein n=1 Tax=Spirodela intermedia TaxID=51605 RepID=A0A7I8IKA9_SPIIN|nr:unnamed protein product [Spirodela intermedia]CAA6658291.1 unnamed protein product [Spirodela intermedia]